MQIFGVPILSFSYVFMNVDQKKSKKTLRKPKKLKKHNLPEVLGLRK